jgi:hypothetical protein
MTTLLLSRAFFLHCFIFTAVNNSQPVLVIWTSIFSASILYFGLRSTVFLDAFVWSISITCPSHLQLSLMFITVTSVLYNFVSYSIILIFHTVCSVAGSHTFLKFFLPTIKPEFYFFLSRTAFYIPVSKLVLAFINIKEPIKICCIGKTPAHFNMFQTSFGPSWPLSRCRN